MRGWLVCVIFLFVAGMLIPGCQCGKSNKNPRPGVKPLSVIIERFDSDLFSSDTLNIEQEVARLSATWPVFFPFFVSDLMLFSAQPDDVSSYKEDLQSFLTDAYIRELAATVEKKYPDLSAVEKELGSAFAHLQYYWPERPAPKVIGFVSGFNWASVTYDSTLLAIGLDMFLGADYKYYPSIFPDFITKKMTQDFLVPSAVKVLGSLYYPDPQPGNTLLDMMIFKGKMLWFMDLLLPDAEDYRKIGMVAQDLIWCRENESEMWSFYINRDLLYSSNSMHWRSYVNEGPTSPGMPPGAPGNTATWLGWQIVRAYMAKNPETTFDRLMYDLDAQTILTLSGYKPKRKVW